MTINNKLKMIALSSIISAALFGCGGTGSSSSNNDNNNDDNNSTSANISINAAGAYPQGYQSVAQFIVTNSSNVTATNLTYDIENDTTGANLAVSNDCSSIPANSSCTLSVTIPATAIQGSFQLVEKPLLFKKVSSNGANIASATVGVAPITEFGNPNFVILPSAQTIQANSTTSNAFLVSVLVNSDNVDSVSLTDGSGDKLSTTVVGSLSLTKGSVNTYKVSVPALPGQSSQVVQVASNVCATGACSNQSTTTIVPPGTGFMVVSPASLQMSASLTSQQLTLSNPSDADVTVTDLAFSPSNSFSYESAGCSALMLDANGQGWVLPANSSCNLLIKYAPGLVSGQTQFAASYTNGNGTQAAITNILYNKNVDPTPFSILTASPQVVNLTSPNTLSGTITIVNTAILSSQEAFTIGQISVSGGVVAFSNDTCSNTTLSVGGSCSVTVSYTAAASAGVDNLTIPYNSATTGSSNFSIPVNYTAYNTYAYITSNSLVDNTAANAIYVYEGESAQTMTYTSLFTDGTSAGLPSADFHPTDAKFSNGYLYVSNLDASNNSSVLLYSVNHNGSLTFESSIVTGTLVGKNSALRLGVGSDLVFVTLGNSVVTVGREGNNLVVNGPVVVQDFAVPIAIPTTIRSILADNGELSIGNRATNNSQIVNYIVDDFTGSGTSLLSINALINPLGGFVNGLTSTQLTSGEFNYVGVYETPTNVLYYVSNDVYANTKTNNFSAMTKAVLKSLPPNITGTVLTSLATSGNSLYVSFDGVNPGVAYYKINSDGSLGDYASTYDAVLLPTPNLGGVWNPYGIAFNQ